MSPGRSISEFRDDYLKQTNQVRQLLGRTFDLDAQDANADAIPQTEYVQTEEYWRIRAADTAMPRLGTLIHDETEALERRLIYLRDQMRTEDGRWGRRSCLLAVPDTTMFLTKDLPIEEIDWQASLDAVDIGVALIVPLVVIHELDRLKRQGNSTTGTAARGAIRWLLDHLPSDPAKHSERLPTSGNRDTTIEVYVHSGPTRPSDADGVIIDFARRLERVAKLPCRLVTRDLGMQLRAQHHGGETVLLPEPEPAKRPERRTDRSTSASEPRGLAK